MDKWIVFLFFLSLAALLARVVAPVGWWGDKYCLELVPSYTHHVLLFLSNLLHPSPCPGGRPSRTLIVGPERGRREAEGPGRVARFVVDHGEDVAALLCRGGKRPAPQPRGWLSSSSTTTTPTLLPRPFAAAAASLRDRVPRWLVSPTTAQTGPR